MRRVLAFALVLGLGNTSAALAGETLLASASRLAREAVRAEAPAPLATTAGAPPRALALAMQGQPALASSGMSRGKKTFIWLVAGVGFAAVAYTIDHKVLDNTLSSLGTRKD